MRRYYTHNEARSVARRGVPFVAQTCSYTPTPSSLTVGAASGLALSPIQLSTGNGCSWSAYTDAGWMHIVSAASGVGSQPNVLVYVD